MVNESADVVEKKVMIFSYLYIITQRKRLRMELTYHWEGLTEHMKSTDQLGWIRKMNSIQSRAEEIVIHQLIYTN